MPFFVVYGGKASDCLTVNNSVCSAQNPSVPQRTPAGLLTALSPMLLLLHFSVHNDTAQKQELKLVYPPLFYLQLTSGACCHMDFIFVGKCISYYKNKFVMLLICITELKCNFCEHVYPIMVMNFD